MSIGPVSGPYRIYGLGHTVQLGSVFTTPGPPPTDSLWPIEGHPEDAYGLAYFHLTRLNNGKYHISLASAPVVSSQSALWANASGGDPLIEWSIESIPQHGETAHLISGPTNDPGGNFTRGWWTSFTPSTRPQAFLDGLLVSTPSIPPYYPSSKVFHIDELDYVPRRGRRILWALICGQVVVAVSQLRHRAWFPTPGCCTELTRNHHAPWVASDASIPYGRPSKANGLPAGRSISTDLSAHPRTDPIGALNTLLKLLSSLSTRIGRCQYKLTPSEHALSLHLVSILDPYVYQGAKTLSNAVSTQVKPTFVGLVFQPTEILDKIMSYLDSRQDLLNVALCCKHMHDVVFPRHFEYRVIRCKVSSLSVWNHLITNHGLARNVRKLEIIDERSSATTIPRTGGGGFVVPRGIVKRDTDLESTDDELVMHRKQEKYFCRALEEMTGLREIKWSCNHSPISIDHVWPTLVMRSRTLDTFDISDNLLFTPRKLEADSEAGSDSEGEHGNQANLLPITSLKKVAFRATRHSYGGSRQPDISRINGMLSRSPDLKSLSISFVRLRSQSGALPRLDDVFDNRWAHLRSLTLIGLRATSASSLGQLLAEHAQLESLHLEISGIHGLVLRSGSLPNIRELYATKEVLSSILETPTEDVRPLEAVRGFKLSGVHAIADGKHADASLFHSLRRYSQTLKCIELLGWNDMYDIRKLSGALPNITNLDVGKRLSPNAHGRGAVQAGPVTNFEEWLEVLDTLPELRALHGIKFFYEISSINLLPPASNNVNLSTPSISASTTHIASGALHASFGVDAAVAAKTHSQMSLMDRSRIKKNDWTASMLVWRCPKLRRVDHWDDGTSRIIALTRGPAALSTGDLGLDGVEMVPKESNKVRWEVRRLKAA